ncbi:unnamed protein product, partial [Amoebophrya sp. A25]
LQSVLRYSVGKVLYSMNGLKLSPAAWAKYRNEVRVSIGWQQCAIEPTLWHLSSVILIIFADNFYFFGDE